MKKPERVQSKSAVWALGMVALTAASACSSSGSTAVVDNGAGGSDTTSAGGTAGSMPGGAAGQAAGGAAGSKASGGAGSGGASAMGGAGQSGSKAGAGGAPGGASGAGGAKAGAGGASAGGGAPGAGGAVGGASGTTGASGGAGGAPAGSGGAGGESAGASGAAGDGGAGASGASAGMSGGAGDGGAGASGSAGSGTGGQSAGGQPGTGGVSGGSGSGGGDTGGQSMGGSDAGGGSSGTAGAGGTTGAAGASGSAGAGTGGAAAGSGGASGASGAAGTGSGTPTFGASCAGSKTVLTGVVFAPNGADPIPHVRVYAASAVKPYPAAYCDKCSSPIDPFYAITTTGNDGSFTLDIDSVPLGADITFVIQIGRFRKVTTLPVTACQSGVVPAPARTLPGNSAAGNIPKIAVSSGNADHLDAILSALGITEYDCYEGRKKPGAPTATCPLSSGKVIADVLADPTSLDAYHMLFLSCAPGAYAHFATTHDMVAAAQNTASWVSGGGRMFATDTAYDYIEQAFPDATNFGGPQAAPGVPQPIDGANIGCSSGPPTPYPANVDDPALTQWLKVVGISSSPSVSIQGFFQPWSVVDSLPPTTRQLVDGSFSMNPSACGVTKDIPLTTEFDVSPCGRVIFSSYHTLSNVNAGSLSAQEKIVEYLMFEAATCQN